MSLLKVPEQCACGHHYSDHHTHASGVLEHCLQCAACGQFHPYFLIDPESIKIMDRIEQRYWRNRVQQVFNMGVAPGEEA